MKKNKFPMLETLLLLAIELLAGVIINVSAIVLRLFDYTVILGTLLGTAVAVLNFVFLSIAVNRALDQVLDGFKVDERKLDEALERAAADGEGSEDGADGEDDDEIDDAAARFAKENQMKVQNAVKLSYIVRTATIVATLIVALLTKQFNLTTTLIPLLTFRAMLGVASAVAEKIRKKEG